MLLGAIADDFTGASDLANTLAKGGMNTVQYVGVPSSPADARCEAGVVSLKTRSIPAAEAVRQSLAAAQWLVEQGCRQILFKYCSTFDSTPLGNIGPVAEALLDFLGADIAVVCPVFPATGRRLFMGHLFVGETLLSESSMRDHPLTPMTDSNIRRWLRLQTRGEVALVTLDAVRSGAAAISDALNKAKVSGARLAVVDATRDEDLLAIGEALDGARLVTGGSGIALGLPENFRRAGLLSERKEIPSRVSGPGVVLCGSCSAASREQVARYAAHHPAFAVQPQHLMDGSVSVESVIAWISGHAGAMPIIYSSAEPLRVGKAQAAFGQSVIAARVESFFAELAVALVARGVRRVVVGGGETSGAVVEALGVDRLHVGDEIDPGVPVLFADGKRPLAIALKSGNFGAADFFEKALERLDGK